MLGQPGCIALVTFFSLREEQKTGCIDTKSFSFTSSEPGMPKHALSEIWDEILVEAWERMTTTPRDEVTPNVHPLGYFERGTWRPPQ